MIRFSKYIDIISAIAGAAQIASRQFGLRIYTPNPLVPVGGDLVTASPADAQSYFGDASEEALRAVKYFNYISPTLDSPQQLSFARWQREATPFMIFGGANTVSPLATLTTIVAGVLTLVIDGTAVEIQAITFAAAASFNAVAADLQTLLNANANPSLATATVGYDAVNARFVITGSAAETAAGTISVTPTGAGITDVGMNLGLYASQGAIYAGSSPIIAPAATFSADDAGNNNFGSFVFIASDGGELPTMADSVAIATANDALNVSHQYYVNVNETNWQAYATALGSIGGCGATFELSTLTEYAEMMPAIVLGATQFTEANGVPGYMFTQFSNQTASVTDDEGSVTFNGTIYDALSDALDAAGVNYYGATQVDGQVVSFFQRGVLFGGADDPQDMNVYANEQWLKDFAATSFMNLQLALKRIPANTTGRGLMLNTINKTIIPAALNNGTISVGKQLTTLQQQAITSLTTNANSWQNVQNKGYVYDVQIVSQAGPRPGSTQYVATYYIIYSKDDLVRAITGKHALI